VASIGANVGSRAASFVLVGTVLTVRGRRVRDRAAPVS
jgi:hypothetical protein